VSRRRLPPLNAIRAFEAAGRHLSFTAAADELAVTPAAISHQIKTLESYFGVRLFERLTRRLVLTSDGRSYLPVVSQAFDRLAEASVRLSDRGVRGLIRVSTMPSFAARWLVPRLAGFRRLHPEVDVDVHASTEKVDLWAGEFDLAIRYGGGRWDGLKSELLLREDVFPVCSPALLDGDHPLRHPSDLRFHTLIHDGAPGSSEPWLGWAAWAGFLGIDGIDVSRGPRYNDSNLIMQAVLAGEGVAIGRTVILGNDLAAGRVVRPFPHSRRAEFSFYVLYAPGAADRAKVRAFTDWIKGEAAAATPLATAP
jgi:LysR family glycine cleavage system transcriptional activator